MAGLGTELFNLATSFDPYGAYKAGARAPAEQEIKDIATQSQLKDARSEQAQQQTGAPLAGMANSILPPGVQLQTPDGIPTSSGLFNQQVMNSQQDLAASAKIMNQAKLMTPGSKDQINAISEARRLQTTATQNIANAKKEYQKSVDDSYESLYSAKSQTEYDQRIQDAIARTGMPPPKGLPETWTPDVRKLLLSKMSPETRTKVEKDERAQMVADRKEKMDTLREQRLEAMLRGGGTASAGKTSAFERMRGEQIIGAVKELERSQNIIAQLPIETTGGLFGSMKAKTGFFDAPLNVGANLATDKEERMYNMASSNIGQALAIIDAGGYKPNQAQIDTYQNKLKWVKGDDVDTKIFAMADAKAQAFARAEVVMANPAVPKEQKEVLKETMDKFNKLVPFDPEDVIKASKNEESINDYLKKKGKSIQSESKLPSSKESTKEDPLGIR